MNPRVRFAPSPTGPLHIGGVRTALYNYLFAKKLGGTLLLRIEDTDRTRFVEGAEDYIIEVFKWLGLTFDEGVGIGGDYGPYRQSERKALYRSYARQLIAGGHAYYAFDTPESLAKRRMEAEIQKKTFQYDTHTRLDMVNSLTLSADEVSRYLASDTPYVIRFRFPEDTDILVHDLIRGDVIVNTRILDDKVLFKSDGMPTYHLANIVDDHLMKISHVIRGEEWLPSTPLHVMLYRAFGWEPPQFAHLPLILKPDGNGKLSKRDGDRLGFPVFPLQWHNPQTGETSSGYRESGYLPEAVLNMLALLGWNPGTEQEIMSLDELVNTFSMHKIGKAGSKFSPDKAKWFNHEYILRRENATLVPLFAETLNEKGIHCPTDYLMAVISLIKDRLNFLTDFWEQACYFFQAPEAYDEKAVKKRWKEGTAVRLRVIDDMLHAVVPFDKKDAHDRVMQYIHDEELNTGQILNSLRIAIVGEAKGPDLFDIIDLLGTDEVHDRVERAIHVIDNPHNNIQI